MLDPAGVGSNITSPFRSWDFDAAVIVLLWPHDLAVARAVEFNVDEMQQRARHRKHVNGAVFVPNRTALDRGLDVTERLADASRLR